MNTDTAIMMLLADLQRASEALKSANAQLAAENAELRAALTAQDQPQD